MKKQKPSEMFEGENSSLRKVYDSIIDDSDQKEYETKECMESYKDPFGSDNPDHVDNMKE